MKKKKREPERKEARVSLVMPDLITSNVAGMNDEED